MKEMEIHHKRLLFFYLPQISSLVLQAQCTPLEVRKKKPQSQEPSIFFYSQTWMTGNSGTFWAILIKHFFGQNNRQDFFQLYIVEVKNFGILDSYGRNSGPYCTYKRSKTPYMGPDSPSTELVVAGWPDRPIAFVNSIYLER